MKMDQHGVHSKSTPSKITDNASKAKPKLYVELVKAASSIPNEQIIQDSVKTFLQSMELISTHSSYTHTDIPPSLRNELKEIKVCELSTSTMPQKVAPNSVELVLNIYFPDNSGPSTEEMEGDAEEEVPVASSWLLPSTEFNRLWDTLIYDGDIKEQLLNLVETTLLFSDSGVDSNIIAWNSVILLHGPPGTGKTSLCKALAQKLSIRLNKRYDYGQLIEINSHSLFSKWFSESGKLVQRLFTRITELVSDPQSLVCVLIDEVESLAASRTSAASGKEPGDAIRVVNALLTQLDQIKRHPNVLILTTSNITGTIDLAFVDRADIKQYIGHPSASAIYQIYYSCIIELFKARIIYPQEHLMSIINIRAMENIPFSKSSQHLYAIAQSSVGLSGRSLRKLPMLAHAYHIRVSPVSLDTFLDAMEQTVFKFKEGEEKV